MISSPSRARRGPVAGAPLYAALLCGFILVHATRAQSPCPDGEDAGAAKPLTDDLMTLFSSRQGEGDELGGLVDVRTAARQQEVLDLMMQSCVGGVEVSVVGAGG